MSPSDPSPTDSGDPFRALIEKALDAVWIIDQNERVEYVNPAIEQIAGYRPDELIGQPLSLIMPKTLASLHWDYLQDYLGQSDRSSVLGRVREFIILAKDGKPVPIELVAFEVEARSGLRRFGAIMRDIRERRKLEDERKLLVNQLSRLARIDDLTNLPNRRAFFEEAARTRSYLNRHDTAACVALLDIDHFKLVNDSHGHAAGDAVLEELSRLCRSALRTEDILARYGGEEFAILLPGTGLKEMPLLLERLRKAVAEHRFRLPDGSSVAITLSAGYTEIHKGQTIEDSLEAADEALYAAKRAGRNCIVAAGPSLAHRAAG